MYAVCHRLHSCAFVYVPGREYFRIRETSNSYSYSIFPFPRAGSQYIEIHT